jgi:hypothetical protein
MIDTDELLQTLVTDRRRELQATASRSRHHGRRWLPPRLILRRRRNEAAPTT